MERILTFNEYEDLYKESDPFHICIFGGTFDPIHAGHLTVIERCIKNCSNIIIAPTVQNPWKTDKATDISHRIEMIKLALAKEPLSSFDYEDFFSTKIFSEEKRYTIYEKNYEYVFELINQVKDSLQSADLSAVRFCFVVGEDTGLSVKNWKNWESMNLTVIIAPIKINTHGNEIRKKKEPLLDSIIEYVEKNSLYQQELI